ncbi:unknown similar to AMEV172 [Choristoneura rosaceana entomopoxvirus 'L']|uniref:Glutaredoxin-2 n=1 Tax=Choristoneura rosaceana entomopoxvirus 'L' TaxID=1293539 RepID=A0ABM9QKN4_9POXV|nr:unknown similar to AMEV172 [Choristoneura rosaceana entomopoxvirus 'L']CCU56085.1 unknown similar to AMEV172 [Choristoneura rosaceana entomopoxvirus 'L']
MNKTTIICMYLKECKICQIINEFLDHLSNTNKIIYNRVNINKIGDKVIELFKNDKDIQKLIITAPRIYIYNNKSFITIDNFEILQDALKYKKSLKNTEKKQMFLDYIMMK